MTEPAKPTQVECTKPERMRDIMRQADRVLDERQQNMVAQLESMRRDRGEVMHDLVWMPLKKARMVYWFNRVRWMIGIAELVLVLIVLYGSYTLLGMLLKQFVGLND